MGCVCLSSKYVSFRTENSSLVNLQFENNTIRRKNEPVKDQKIVISDYSFDPSRRREKSSSGLSLKTFLFWHAQVRFLAGLEL